MKTFLSAISDKKPYTLHSHTQFCDARAPMEDFAREAVAQGFSVYGFSPHSPIPFKSHCNMTQEDVPLYLAEVDRLQGLYPDVRFLKGMEIDYIGDEWGPASPYFATLPLDYSIGSVHFIPNQEGTHIDIDGRFDSFREKMGEFFHNDIEYVVRTYFSQMQKMIAAGGFDIVGHLDKVKHNAGLFCPGLVDSEMYRRLADDLVDAVIASGLVVEINTKQWREFQQLYPDQKHWKRLLQAGVPIVVNSDAHFPRLINDGRQPVINCLEYLKRKL